MLPDEIKLSLEECLEHGGRDRMVRSQWEVIREMALRRDDFRCKCGKTATEVDHIVPVRLGGSDGLDNLQSLCPKCHRAKTRQDLTKINRLKKFERYKNRIGGFD